MKALSITLLIIAVIALIIQVVVAYNIIGLNYCPAPGMPSTAVCNKPPVPVWLPMISLPLVILSLYAIRWRSYWGSIVLSLIVIVGLFLSILLTRLN